MNIKKHKISRQADLFFDFIRENEMSKEKNVNFSQNLQKNTVFED